MDKVTLIITAIKNREKGALLACFIVALTILHTIWGLLTRRPKDSPPCARLGMPLIGNYIEFAKNPVDCIKKGQAKYGDVFTMQMMHKNLTFFLGPEASKDFYMDKKHAPKEIYNQEKVYGFMTPVFGKDVVYDAPPDKRVEQMATMSRALLRGNVWKTYVEKVEEECKMYCERRMKEDKGEVDLLVLLSELTISTSSRCLHGDDVRKELGDEVAHIYHDLDQGVQPLSFFFPYAPTAAHKKRDEARIKMVEKFSKVIDARRKQNLDTDSTTDILQEFINMRYKCDATNEEKTNGSQLTNDQIVGLLIALLFAGQHTSSITSTWTMFYLMFHPEAMKKVKEEQELLYGKNLDGCPGSWEVQKKITYLEGCIQESLRLQPPLIMLMRMNEETTDVEFTDSKTGEKKNYTVPAGDICVVSPSVTHKIDKYFPDCEKYDPERFLEKTAVDEKSPFGYKTKANDAFVGFGKGRHMCLGNRFGIFQVTCIVSYLLRNYDFKPVSKEFPEPDYTAMVVGPKGNLTCSYERYSKARLDKAQSERDRLVAEKTTTADGLAK